MEIRIRIENEKRKRRSCSDENGEMREKEEKIDFWLLPTSKMNWAKQSYRLWELQTQPTCTMMSPMNPKLKMLLKKLWQSLKSGHHVQQRHHC